MQFQTFACHGARLTLFYLTDITHANMHVFCNFICCEISIFESVINLFLNILRLILGQKFKWFYISKMFAPGTPRTMRSLGPSMMPRRYFIGRTSETCSIGNGAVKLVLRWTEIKTYSNNFVQSVLLNAKWNIASFKMFKC